MVALVGSGLRVVIPQTGAVLVVVVGNVSWIEMRDMWCWAYVAIENGLCTVVFGC